MKPLSKMLFVKTSSNQGLLSRILKNLNQKTNIVDFSHFKDGETAIKLFEDVSRQEVCVVSSPCKPVNESIMDLLLLVSTLKRCGASKVHVLATYVPYARQDRPVREYKSLSGIILIFSLFDNIK